MSTATFLKTDSTTDGTWYNGSSTLYGADGYGLPDPNNVLGANNPKWPSYATVTIAGGTAFAWDNSISNANALEYPPVGTSNGSDTNRIWSCWYANSSFTVDVQDGNAHQIALYFSTGASGDASRDIQVQIADDNNNNAVLDTRSVTVTYAGGGVWLAWIVSGKVTFTLSILSGANAIVDGIFFDPAPMVFRPFVSRPRFEAAHYE